MQSPQSASDKAALYRVFTDLKTYWKTYELSSSSNGSNTLKLIDGLEEGCVNLPDTFPEGFVLEGLYDLLLELLDDWNNMALMNR